MVIQGIYKELNQNKEFHTMVKYWTVSRITKSLLYATG